MANKTNNLLEAIVWQNANQGLKKSKQTRKPEPFIPDFMKPPKKPAAINKNSVATDTRSIDNILAQPRG